MTPTLILGGVALAFFALGSMCGRIAQRAQLRSAWFEIETQAEELEQRERMLHKLSTDIAAERERIVKLQMHYEQLVALRTDSSRSVN